MPDNKSNTIQFSVGDKSAFARGDLSKGFLLEAASTAVQDRNPGVHNYKGLAADGSPVEMKLGPVFNTVGKDGEARTARTGWYQNQDTVGNFYVSVAAPVPQP